MPLKGKHIVEEINGERCTIIEKGITSERVAFLKKLLEHNGLTVMVGEDAVAEGAPKTFTLGVTDIIFNPTIAVYEQSLRTPEGKKVHRGYWEQTGENKSEYWEM